MEPTYAPPPAVRNRGSKVPVWAVVLIGCAGLGFLGVIVLGAVLFPVFSQARERARTTVCASNLKQAGLATLMYVQDYDEHLPPSSRWMDVTAPFIRNEQVYHCPNISIDIAGPYGYAYFSTLSGKSMDKLEKQPRDTLAIFDSANLARNAADAGTSLALSPPRHLGTGVKGVNAAMLDGHVLFKTSQSDPGLPPR